MTFFDCLFFVKPIAGPQLKVVSTMSVGYDHISLPETTKRWQFAYCTYFRHVRNVGCWVKKPGLFLICIITVLYFWARHCTLTEPQIINNSNKKNKFHELVCLLLFWLVAWKRERKQGKSCNGEVSHVVEKKNTVIISLHNLFKSFFPSISFA